MKQLFLIIPGLLGLMLIFTQCNTTKYQYSAYQKVHHKVENSDYYNTLNDFQKDFLILANIVKESYPNRKEILSDSLWEISLEKGLKNLENATDTIAILEYQKFLALLKNNHTEIEYPTIYSWGDKIFLFTPYYLDNKWIIFNVHQDYPQKLISSELLAINGITMDTVFDKIKPYLNEESTENMYNAAYKNILFGRQEFIEALGLHNKQNPDLMILRVKDSTGIVKDVDIAVKRIKDEIKWSKNGYGTRNSIVKTDSGYVYRFFPEEKTAYLQINTFLDKGGWKKGIKKEVPIIFWPFAFNMLRNAYKGKPRGRLRGVKPGTENISEFYEDFFTKLKQSNCENLIIDVRNNHGGDLFHTYQLLSFLTDRTDINDFARYIKYNEFYEQLEIDKRKERNTYLNLPKETILFDTLVKVSSHKQGSSVFDKIDDEHNEYYVNRKDKIFRAKVYVLISPNSASAATAFPVLIKDNNLGTLVGRSPANRTAKQTSFTRFKLPNTSIVISLSTLYLIRPNKANTNEILQPDYHVPVELSRNDYTFDYVLELIKAKEE
jgi:hypothetical protein